MWLEVSQSAHSGLNGRSAANTCNETKPNVRLPRTPLRGTLASARDGPSPDSAETQSVRRPALQCCQASIYLSQRVEGVNCNRCCRLRRHIATRRRHRCACRARNRCCDVWRACKRGPNASVRLDHRHARHRHWYLAPGASGTSGRPARVRCVAARGRAHPCW